VELKKIDVLRNLTFGARVAEEETDDLAKYFVETAQWSKIYSGAVDIVYGAKGSGKSALYSLLIKRANELFDRNVILVAGENPRGAPAFRSLNDDPPSSEVEFVLMWKLYFIVLIADAFSDYGITNNMSSEVISVLEDSGLRRKGGSLASVIRSVIDYVRAWSLPKAIEAEVSTNPSTGHMTYRGRITPREVVARDRVPSAYSIDALLELADQALQSAGFTIWLLLDRLDVAFTESEELEENALRALFKAYLDINDKKSFRAKIFLRSDIWTRITVQGFRESSHITTTETVSWDKSSLQSLIVRRVTQNENVCAFFEVSAQAVAESYEEQTRFFDRIFPAQVDPGEKRPSTIDWVLTRTQDGTQQTAPRELIHLMNSAVQQQTRRLEMGETEPDGENLFSGQAIKNALAPVSKTRLEQTIYAEYPSLKNSIEQFEGGKAEYDAASLSHIWSVSQPDATRRAEKLVEIGFFEQRGSRQEPTYWIPFLYRDALSIVQGAAFEKAAPP
jgi:hypothetical protein